MTILPHMGTPIPYDEYAQIIIESGVKIVETAGSNPKKWIPLFKKAGLTTIHKCVAVRHALSAQKLGVDIISLDGFECAGHPGEDDIGNFVLQAVGAKKLTVPFICSGYVCPTWCQLWIISKLTLLCTLRRGVGNGAQLAAALALGADGVNLGGIVFSSQLGFSSVW